MFEKLDPYDVLANLVPGAALTYALHFSKFPTPAPTDWAAFLLVAFVAGVTTNRLGSLVLDPLLRRMKFLKPKNYDAFVASEKVDKKLQTLVANIPHLLHGWAYLFGSECYCPLVSADSFLKSTGLYSVRACRDDCVLIRVQKGRRVHPRSHRAGEGQIV